MYLYLYMLCLFVCCWWFSYFKFWYINANHSLGEMPLVKLFKRASKQWPSQSQKREGSSSNHHFSGAFAVKTLGMCILNVLEVAWFPPNQPTFDHSPREFRSVILAMGWKSHLQDPSWILSYMLWYTRFSATVFLKDSKGVWILMNGPGHQALSVCPTLTVDIYHKNYLCELYTIFLQYFD